MTGLSFTVCCAIHLMNLAGWEEVIGIEMEEEYVRIARARLEHWGKAPKQMELI